MFINLPLEVHVHCTCCTTSRLSPLSCIVRSSFSNRRSDSLNNICKGKFYEMLIQQKLMLGAQLSDLLWYMYVPYHPYTCTRDKHTVPVYIIIIVHIRVKLYTPHWNSCYKYSTTVIIQIVGAISFRNYSNRQSFCCLMVGLVAY